MFNLHFDIHFVSCSYDGEFRGQFGFFHLNLLVSNILFLIHLINRNKSYYRQKCLRYTCGNSKYIKNDGYLVLKGQIKVISFQRH